MLETIVTKRCCTCKEIKPASEFYKASKRKDGLHNRCKQCDKVYSRTPERKAHQRAYEQTEKRKARRSTYRKSDKCKAIQRAAAKRYYKRNLKKRKAADATNGAIRAGKFPRPDSFKCSCGSQAEQYHHYLGYAREHWFDVIALCRSCHKKIHILKPSRSSV